MTTEHTKTFGNSYEVGDLVRVKTLEGCATNILQNTSGPDAHEFSFDTLFVCLEVMEDGQVWSLLAPSGQCVLCHHVYLELVRFAHDKDEDDDKERV